MHILKMYFRYLEILRLCSAKQEKLDIDNIIYMKSLEIFIELTNVVYTYVLLILSDNLNLL